MKFPAHFARRAAWGRNVRPMLERLAFACHLALVVGSCALTGLGVVFAFFMNDVRPLCVGLAAGALSRLLHQHGYRAWNFRRWEESLEPRDLQSAGGTDSAHGARVRELEQLLEQMTQLDEARGGRDVWAVQALRQRVKALLAKDPALREECADLLARHPALC